MTKREEHITTLYIVIIVLLVILALHHWMGFNYLCCETKGGGVSCWDDAGPGLLTPGLSEESRDELSNDCRVLPSHVHWDFMEPSVN